MSLAVEELFTGESEGSIGVLAGGILEEFDVTGRKVDVTSRRGKAEVGSGVVGEEVEGDREGIRGIVGVKTGRGEFGEERGRGGGATVGA